MALHSGYDTISPIKEPAEWPKCITCGEDMLKEPDVVSATSFAEGMAGGKHKHIRFTCLNAGTDWHNQIIGLMKAIKETPSKVLEDLMKKEIKQILKKKKCTKKWYGF